MSDEKIEDMNIQQKIMAMRTELRKKEIPKSGWNKHGKFHYHELDDLTPIIQELCEKYNVFLQFSFTRDNAILSAQNLNNLEEIVEETSPMPYLDLKNVNIDASKDALGPKLFRIITNTMQGIGAAEKYQRRYLYITLFDITEKCSIDSTDDEFESKETQSKKTSLSIDDKDVLNLYNDICKELGSNKPDNNDVWKIALKRKKEDPEGITKELLGGLKKHLDTLKGAK